jgi:hypothetical protein
MSLKNRLHRIEKLGHLHGTAKQRPATIERTASGEYFVLSGADRLRIGDEAAFAKWKAEGNRCGVVIEGLTPTGSELVRRIIGGERTEKKGRD